MAKKTNEERTGNREEMGGWEGEEGGLEGGKKEVGRKFRREGGAWEDEKIAAIEERRGRELIRN